MKPAESVTEALDPETKLQAVAPRGLVRRLVPLRHLPQKIVDDGLNLAIQSPVDHDQAPHPQ